mgnify:CR=1 FL=1|tara:strand:- start:104 stop:607 length:504 start_codon:yes stop_codon:yes gene_type:complete
MPDLQHLQTIVATTDAIPILKALPRDLHPYIFRFIEDEVKVHYWMDKYDWTDTIHTLGNMCYYEFYMVRTYFRHVKDEHFDLNHFMLQENAYREKVKWRDAQGWVIRVKWSLNVDNCDYDAIHDRLGDMIYELYETRRNINGLYKLLSHLLTLWDDMEKTNLTNIEE